MRYALIDNSTLTSVQRLLGQIPIRSKSILDADILCLENVIEAILFYDTVLVLDDYKPSFSKQRQKFFSDFLMVGSDILPFDKIRSATGIIADDITPRVEAGFFTDKDFKPFFEMLQMNVIFTWDMCSSTYCLTQKILEDAAGVDIEKYSRLHSAIYGELLDKNRSEKHNVKENEPILVDKNGKFITRDYEVIDSNGSRKDTLIPGDVSAFLDGLNWLAFRTIFYTLSSHSLNADLFLHPIRHAFQYNFLSKLNQSEFPVYHPVIQGINQKSEDTLKQILSNSQPFITQNKIPLFVNWFAQRVGSPKDYINHALQLRQAPEFVEARRRLMELEFSLHDGKFAAKTNTLMNEVTRALESISSKYGGNSNQGVSSSFISTLWNLGAMFTPLPKAPNIDIRIKKAEFLKHIIPHKGFSSIHRSIVSDLSQISRLGENYEKITSEIVLSKEVYGCRIKTEQLRFVRSRSNWKIPM